MAGSPKSATSKSKHKAVVRSANPAASRQKKEIKKTGAAVKEPRKQAGKPKSASSKGGSARYKVAKRNSEKIGMLKSSGFEPSAHTSIRSLLVASHDAKIEVELLHCAVNIDYFHIRDTGQNIIVEVTNYHKGEKIRAKDYVFSPHSGAALEALFLRLCRKIAGEGLIIYHHNSKIFERMRTLILLSRQPYALLVSNDISFNWLQQHFVAGARARFTLSEETRSDWRGRFVFDCAHVDRESITPLLTACSNRDRKAQSVSGGGTPKSPAKTAAKVKKGSTNTSVLLISYFMPPAETVAVHRLDYWQEALPKIAKSKRKSLNVTVLTAIESYKNDSRYIVVPDRGDYGVDDISTQALVDRAKASRVNYFAAYWASHVRQYFDANPDVKFDSIVISGNPFFYFELGAYFKEKWDAKIILDFRDPLANNPRFVYSDAHKSFVNDLEDAYLSTADYALSVNKYCVDALRLPTPEIGHVVANGYDERIIDKIKPIKLRTADNTMSFVYTGSFYADRNAEHFLACLNPKQHKLIHIGRQAATDSHLDAYPAMERYGLMPYSDVIGYCRSMDAGIIFTSGAPFEQTTKIFDYIATGIDIIIVTDGEVQTGELENLTKNLEGVYWVKNNPASITKFLKRYAPSSERRKLTQQFSRRKQTERLYSLIMR